MEWIDQIEKFELPSLKMRLQKKNVITLRIKPERLKGKAKKSSFNALTTGYGLEMASFLPMKASLSDRQQLSRDMKDPLSKDMKQLEERRGD